MDSEIKCPTCGSLKNINVKSVAIQNISCFSYLGALSCLGAQGESRKSHMVTYICNACDTSWQKELAKKEGIIVCKEEKDAISKYKIIEYFSIEKLENEVEQFLEQGYELHGDLKIVSVGSKLAYIQAMKK